MSDDLPATIAIERATGGILVLRPLRVFIDGRLAGLVRRGRRGEYMVPAGEHVIAVSLGPCGAGPLRVIAGPGDRVELICEANQPPHHPWHVQALWLIVLYVALDSAGSLIPEIRAFVRNFMVVEVLISAVFGLVGMMLYFRRVIALKAWQPALSLAMVSNSDR